MTAAMGTTGSLITESVLAPISPESGVRYSFLSTASR